MNSRESEKPQLVAIDVDGTLARSDGSLSEKTCETIAKVRSTGTKVIIATGRPWLVALDCVEKLGEVDFVVCSNGAMTVSLPSEEILEDIYLPFELPEKLVRSLRSKIPGIDFAYEFKRGVKAQNGLAERLPAGVPLGDPIDDVLNLDPRPVRKILTWHDDFKLSDLGHLITAVVGNYVEISSSGLDFFEFGTIGVSKATALEKLTMQLKIDPKKTWAFGDEQNDIEMLKWAGCGYAMSNAEPSVKEASDFVAPSNDEDGVAVTLESVF
ncbi:MAG: Cof-type HAD-IIB family hydrolase [Actinomycetota bacterium]|nr:Cof-type HAD-IIB family hydrolase [Actinomycetota bacterium]